MQLREPEEPSRFVSTVIVSDHLRRPRSKNVADKGISERTQYPTALTTTALDAGQRIHSQTFGPTALAFVEGRTELATGGEAAGRWRHHWAG